MTSLFPTCQWSERLLDGMKVRYWEIVLEPVPPASEMPLVIADLIRDGIIDVEQNGRLRHHPRCHAAHDIKPELRGLEINDGAFLIELTYREPPRYPAARCVEPLLTKATVPGHQHFYPGDIICPLFPPDGTWQWRSDTASDYLTHVAIWLFKTLVWMATQQKSGAGIWLGSEVDHSLERLIRTLPDDDCPCGSGRKYRQCCRPLHRAIQAEQQSPRNVVHFLPRRWAYWMPRIDRS